MHIEPDQFSWSQWIKHHRQLHKWTQQQLASTLGATPLTISRWERNIDVPQLHFREKLFALFEGETQGQKQEPAEMPFPSPLAFVRDPAIPLLPVPTKGLIGRDSLLQGIKSWLFTHNGSLALKGMFGVGKTALAAELALDHEVHTFFSRGILWAGLGPKPNILGLLSRWGTLLAMDPIKMGKLTSVRDWTTAMHDAIGLQRMLLIIDDAWSAEAAFFFRVGGPNCVHLITTRSQDVAQQFAPQSTFKIEELKSEESMQLLHALASQVVAEEPEEAKKLVHLVGGLPLALTIIGKHLQKQVDSQQPRRVQAALERLHHAEARLRVTMLLPPNDRPPNLSDGVSISLQAALEVSDEQLSQAMRASLGALSIFPAKPNSFSEEAAIDVGGVSIESLDVLTDAGFLESSGLGRYSLHQTIRDFYARYREPSVENRLLNFFVSFIQNNATNYDVLEIEVNNILVAFQKASKKQVGNVLEVLMQGINAFAQFLEARGMYSLMKPYLRKAQEGALFLENDQVLTTTYLHLGKIAELSGDVAKAVTSYQRGLEVVQKIEDADLQSRLLSHLGEVLVNAGDHILAEQYLLEGLTLAQQLRNERRTVLLLKNLGEVADCRGNTTESNELYLQALKLARQLSDWETMGTLLQNLGVNAERSGKYTKAKQYYQEGLRWAHKIRHQQRISAIQMNMGMLAFKQEYYQEAEQLYNESLKIAQKIRNQVRISSVLQNLGMLYTVQQRYELAGEYLQKSLDIAYAINHAWLISETLCAWGDCYLAQKQEQAASRAFQESLTKAREIEGQELIALALFGLARVKKAGNDLVKAASLGKESHHLFQEMGNEKANVIAQWLREIHEQ